MQEFGKYTLVKELGKGRTGVCFSGFYCATKPVSDSLDHSAEPAQPEQPLAGTHSAKYASPEAHSDRESETETFEQLTDDEADFDLDEESEESERNSSASESTEGISPGQVYVNANRSRVVNQNQSSSRDSSSQSQTEEEYEKHDVVVKILNPEFALDAAYLQIFHNYSTAAKALENRCEGVLSEIIDVFHQKTDPIRLGVVYNQYRGTLLSNYIPKSGLPVVEALEILEPIALALDYLHENEMVYGSLVPNNILLDKISFTPRFLDFGIPMHCHWMGTLQAHAYSSPEELTSRVLNPEAERYHFGLLCYHVLAGQLPWDRRTKENIIQTLKLQNRLPPISVHCPTISIELLATIMQMLHPEPRIRPSKCIAIVDELRRSLETEETTAATPFVSQEMLERAKLKASQLDSQLATLEKRMTQREIRLKEAERNHMELDARAKQKFNDIAEPWQARLLKVKSNIEKSLEEESQYSRSMLDRYLPTFTSAGRRRLEREEKRQELELQLEALTEESTAEITKAEQRRDRSITDSSTRLKALRVKIVRELSAMLTERHQKEEELLELGEIHPRLLGFRAKKPLSRASLKIGRIRQEMILIPRGEFEMGSHPGTPGVTPEEMPAHRVSLSKSFWMLSSPVTQKLYQSLFGRNPSRFINPNKPVEQISWHDAIQFCNALSLRESLQPCYEVDPNNNENVRWKRDANGYRLPTEAEWEYAARAGRGYIYAGSNDPLEVAWFEENADGQTHIIDLKKPNIWGLYDLSGNVFEWCWDCDGPYKADSQQDPVGPTESKGRIFRGGSYLVGSHRVRVTYRGSERPHHKLDGLGLRIVRNSR